MPAVDGSEQFRLGAPDARLYVEFHLHPVENEDETAKQGRPIFEDREYIRVQAPGDRLLVSDKALTPALKAMYAQQYQAWKSGEDADAAAGTPLSMWPGVTRAQVEELKFVRARTVEQLAGMTDGALATMGPGYMKVRQAARDFVEQSAGRAPLTALRAENDDLKARLAALEEQMGAVLKAKEAVAVPKEPLAPKAKPPKPAEAA